MDRFCEYLQSRIQEGLPGIAAQGKMAPVDGGKRPFRPPAGIRYQDSAVLILITCPAFDDNGYRVLLTLRSMDMPTHKGQISLPGGRIEKGETETNTAVREAWEEVGIHSNNIKVLGRLTSLYIPNSMNYVHPVIACADKELFLVPNNREVEEAFFVGLDDLANPGRLRSENWVIHDRVYRVPFWDIHDTTPLWGATAMILSELVELYRIFEAEVKSDSDS